MNKVSQLLAISILLAQNAFAEEDPHLYGCYFSQVREPGEWVTTTAALFIEKAPNGILLHGSVSSWKNSWISSPDNESPVLLQKSANKFVYHSDNSSRLCKLVLHYDKESVYVEKYDQGCVGEWNTGDGIGPRKMNRADKQPTSDMCLSYLGITVGKEAKNKEQAPTNN